MRPRQFRLRRALLSRHPRSLANHAHMLAKRGDDHLLREIRHLHDSQFRLSREGIRQVRRQKKWLAAQGLLPADVYFTSGYVRTQEAAREMDLGVPWHADDRLNERNWRWFGELSEQERDARYPHWRADYARDPLGWEPPGGGETLKEHISPFGDFWDDINARYPGKVVFAIGHGDKWAVGQLVIEGMSREHFTLHNRGLHLDNCHLIDYMRFPDGHVRKRFIDPFRGICTEWQVILTL